MFSRKNLVVIGIILSSMVYFSGCGQFLNAEVGDKNIAETDENRNEDDIRYEITDIDRNVSEKDAVAISLSNMVEDKDGENGYRYEKGILTLCRGGSYIISGKAQDCRLVISVFDDEIVHLIFDNMELHTDKGPAVYVEQAGKVVITLKENTENTLSDGTEYETATEACLFSNSDLTINGGGRLNVYGYYHDAIRSKDRVKIVDADLYIRSQNDGIRGNDGIVCENSVIWLESRGTGFLTNSEKGYVVISGGSCKVTAGENAIFADQFVSIRNCDSDLYSVHEAVRCSGTKEIEEESEK